MIDKSKFKTLGGETDEMWSSKDRPLQVGAQIEGVYAERIENTGKKKNSTIHIIEVGADKKRVGVWGGVVLDRRLKEVPFGSNIALEYKGKANTKDGNQYNDYWVGVGAEADVQLEEEPEEA